MRSKRSQEGYLSIDHRAGEGTALVRGGTQFEAPTITCAHCHAIVVVNPKRSRSRAYCRKCDQHICDICEAKRVAAGHECHNLNVRIDRSQEAAARGRLSPGGIILP